MSIRGKYVKDKILMVKYHTLHKFRDNETKFHCQKCGGVIGIRSDKRGTLSNFDRCIMCGQGYEYSDLKFIEE